LTLPIPYIPPYGEIPYFLITDCPDLYTHISKKPVIQLETSPVTNHYEYEGKRWHVTITNTTTFTVENTTVISYDKFESRYLTFPDAPKTIGPGESVHLSIHHFDIAGPWGDYEQALAIGVAQ
jgi:hypothetical protein